jgi:hypothetical protein
VTRAPVKVLDSTTGFNRTGPLTAGTPATLTLSATSLPAGTTGAVLAVSTRGLAGSGSLTVAGGAASPTGRTGDVISSIWTTDLVVVPVGADRTLTFATTAAGGADLRATLLATLR